MGSEKNRGKTTAQKHPRIKMFRKEKLHKNATKMRPNKSSFSSITSNRSSAWKTWENQKWVWVDCWDAGSRHFYLWWWQFFHNMVAELRRQFMTRRYKTKAGEGSVVGAVNSIEKFGTCWLLRVLSCGFGTLETLVGGKVVGGDGRH